MKRLIVFLIIVIFIAGNEIIAFAGNSANSAMPQKIMVYLKPDINVEMNGTKFCFYDATGRIVYPIIYKGSTYLPVRAASALMKEPIEWYGATKTVFIGKTITSPNKSIGKIPTEAAIAVSDSAITVFLKPILESAYLRPDIPIMYDFEMCSFIDVNGDTVYPIIYNGSTYLPVRSISNLMKEPIEWNGKTQTISIGSEDKEITSEDVDEDVDVATEPGISASAKKLKDMFNQEEVIYYEATEQATKIRGATSAEEHGLIAASIADSYQKSHSMLLDIKDLDTSGFTEDEIVAVDKLTAYADSTKYYILILQNISYMASDGSDYSGLAETFLFFALDSQTKMEDARIAIQGLN